MSANAANRGPPQVVPRTTGCASSVAPRAAVPQYTSLAGTHDLAAAAAAWQLSANDLLRLARNSLECAVGLSPARRDELLRGFEDDWRRWRSNKTVIAFFGASA